MMEGRDKKISDLEDRIERLVRTQIDFQKEISALRDELKGLQQTTAADELPSAGMRGPMFSPDPATTQKSEPPETSARPRPPVRPIETRAPDLGTAYSRAPGATPRPDPVSEFYNKHTASARADLEKFIGENLISKIGILVLIIGIGIGVKYSIDNNLISPLTRIILAYLVAFGLVGTAIKLKPKYLNFSAALFSGGMASMYFVTYFAFTVYALIDRLPAFGLMAMCTVFTVIAAVFYNRQVIAHIGLVGAYAIPFLLSADSGNYLTLFVYVAIINGGILAVSIIKYWPSIVYAASLFTWLIYGAWFLTRYVGEEHFGIGLVFAGIFFALLYASSLIHRLLKPEHGKLSAGGLVITNSFIFYGFGYSILSGNEPTAGLLGLYTAAHSALHLAVASLAARIKATQADVIPTLTVLVLTFASIAIPVQLDGNQVTMAWSVEAAILFWFGRARGIRLFELYSYPVMLLATGSLFFDWGTAYLNRTAYTSEFNLQPFANGNLITALVYIAAFSLIVWIDRDHVPEKPAGLANVRSFGHVIVGLTLFVLYNTFRLEISNYFHLQAVLLRESAPDVGSSGIRSISNLNVVWQMNYTLLYLAAMAFVNILKIRSAVLAYANSLLALAALAVMATAGMATFYELRISYMAGEGDYGSVWIRVVSYVAAAVLLFAVYLYSRDKLMLESFPAWAAAIGYEVVAYSFGFIAASCELVNTMAQLGLPDATKLGLTIFWGIYALMLIIVGIAWNRKHLRVAAIVLIGVTLAKLFFYDVADLDTIPRTILFVSLGLTLLVISFLYNKYKNAIFGFAGESEE